MFLNIFDEFETVVPQMCWNKYFFRILHFLEKSITFITLMIFRYHCSYIFLSESLISSFKGTLRYLLKVCFSLI